MGLMQIGQISMVLAREQCDAGVSFISPFSGSILLPFDSWTTYTLFSPLSSLGPLPYLEWTIKLVDRARKAGFGHIGMVMECASFQGETMMMDKAGQGDVASRFSPSGETGLSHSLGKGQEKEAEGGAHGRPRRDTIMLLGSGKEW
jgi:hypothetical protein